MNTLLLLILLAHAPLLVMGAILALPVKTKRVIERELTEPELTEPEDFRD